MKVEVSEATGRVLDWMVDQAEGLDWRLHSEPVAAFLRSGGHSSTDWADGGPIIEREEIGIKRRAPSMPGEKWEAMGSITARGAGYSFAVGPTPLIAAMRCYVQSKLGGEVEVPDELCRII